MAIVLENWALLHARRGQVATADSLFERAVLTRAKVQGEASLPVAESHYLWGRRYLLSVVEEEAKPSVRLSHRKITLSVRPGGTSRSRTRRGRNALWSLTSRRMASRGALIGLLPTACR